jgi:hypothetical protein
LTKSWENYQIWWWSVIVRIKMATNWGIPNFQTNPDEYLCHGQNIGYFHPYNWDGNPFSV